MSHMLMLLDTAGLYFRAFHAIPPSVTAPDGTPVNAVRGFLDMLAHLVASRRPDELVACWDEDWRPAWRVALLPSYKAHRVAGTATAGPDPAAHAGPNWVEVAPEGLSAQVWLITELLAAIGVPIIGAPGFEADDVIVTLARAAAGPGRPVEVVTGDRDLLQAVSDAAGIRVLYIGRGMARMQIFDEAAVESAYLVRPDQYADFAALRGDPSDGLPGIPGIGPKTAAELLNRFHGAQALLAAAELGDPGLRPTVAAKLRAHGDYLRAAQQVVHAATVATPDGPWPKPTGPRDPARLDSLARRWGVVSPVQRLLDSLIDAPEPTVTPRQPTA
jgi:5'-3' exonuclease